MAVQLHDPTAAIPSRAESSSPPPKTRLVGRFIRTTLKQAGSFASRFCALLTPPATDLPTISCGDPAEAYLHACIASPFFCYVSPTIYGLTISGDGRNITQRSTDPGDDL